MAVFKSYFEQYRFSISLGNSFDLSAGLHLLTSALLVLRPLQKACHSINF